MILPIEEGGGGGGGGGGRKSSQIDKVNKILEESCRSHGFLFVEQRRCWRDPSIGEVNQSLYWRDGLHLKKKGYNMLAKVYADNIRNALNKTTSHHPLHQPLKETSTPPMLSSSSCSYVHVSPQPTTSPPNFAIYHRCHHRPQFKRRRQKKFKTSLHGK